MRTGGNRGAAAGAGAGAGTTAVAHKIGRFFCSPSIAFILFSSALLGSAAFLFASLVFSRFSNPYALSSPSLGCKPDGEGSWTVGVFYGDSPLALRPIESWDVWLNGSAAWPVANPLLTCASVSEAGTPSNFVADPFLHIDGDILYLFFETKNSVTMQGDIGVAVSKDSGSTWQHLGIALDETWHLSYPYVFHQDGQIYMLPESSQKGDLRLYKAVNFPLQWQLERIILKKPLIDSFIIQYQGIHWLFGSDFSGFGATKNGELEIWYSESLHGPWKPHRENPVYNVDKSLGARNAGRPFIYNGELYRTGQDCGETYGRKLRLFKITVLTADKYNEVEVPLGIEVPGKDRNAWNGARHHHLDVQKLSSEKWIAVMDGDRVPSGDSVYRLLLGYSSFCGAGALVLLTGVLLGAINCILPLSRCLPISEKRRDVSLSKERYFHFYSKLGWFLASVNRSCSTIQGRLKHNTWTGRMILSVIFLIGVLLSCVGTLYVYGGNGAEEAYPLNGYYSQFTLVTMTYDARLWNLKMYVQHYSRCSSVREIVVVWNKGQPPNESDFDSTVPIRIRVEKENSLNNRFRADPLIKTRAVLELDDDIMMACDDVERGFRVWRENPDRIVGFYPRLAEGSPLKYRGEKYARSQNGYNMILTGAAFIDISLASQRYWDEKAAMGRDFVHTKFNCEDVLLNFLYANASSARTVEYVKPSWAIDTSKFSGVAISQNTQSHYQVRSDCLVKFAELYGNLNKWPFASRKDGWDI